MKICVVGLWHLGCVTAACLASVGHDVAGIDADGALIERLRDGEMPVHEPGLTDLVVEGLSAGRLHFTEDFSEAADADVVWVTFDTPVDDNDRADVAWVFRQFESVMSHLAPGSVVLISSQLPVGSTRMLARRLAASRPSADVTFAYSPENLRLGKALDAFLHPERVVIGIDQARARDQIEQIFAPITDQIEWMRIESAEMAKHAINAFLALSITFTNELAVLAERVDADAREVERALRSEPRIGRDAYVTPGAAFAGGTLARDVTFLGELGAAHGTPTNLVDAILASNAAHSRWAFRTLESELGDLRGRPIAVLGLTYKVGTDTLRRSAAIELCRELVRADAHVSVHDPVATAVPDDLSTIERTIDAEAAVRGSVAVVLATPWPEYRALSAPVLQAAMGDRPLVVDPAAILRETLSGAPGVIYRTVGSPRT